MADPLPAHASSSRLAALDGLRGVAAVIVMLYHFTLRYRERSGIDWQPLFSFDGQFGVLLFFMISGYVITLTTSRVRRPVDFAFFRFSRLYPTYLACMVITTLLMLAAGGPKPMPTLASFAANFTMLTKSLRRFLHMPNDLPYIDGAYWSLEIELFFYLLVFALLLIRQANRLLVVTIGMLVISGVDYWLQMTGQAGVPSQVRWLLFFEYWPYFGVGIALYAMRNQRQFFWPGVTLALCVARACERVIADALHLAEPARQVSDSAPTVPWIELTKFAVCAIVFTLAVYDRLPVLRWRVMLALGAISYPLYLLHQNIGYILIGWLHDRLNVPANVTLVLTVVAVIALAAVVSMVIERPSMHLLRQFYLRRTQRVAPAAPVSGLAPTVPISPSDRMP